MFEFMDEGINRDIFRLKATLGVVAMMCFAVLAISSVVVFALYTQSVLSEINEPVDSGDGKYALEDGGYNGVGSGLGGAVFGYLVEGDKRSSDDGHGHFKDVDIIARSAIVWDIREGVAIFEKNPGESLPLASLTKMMTAVVALEEAYSGFQVSINSDSLQQYGNSGLFLEERWDLENLVKMSMMTSANDASHAIASAVGSHLAGSSGRSAKEVFVARMNQKSRELGLSSTFFNNSTGLDMNERTAGAYGSVLDVLNLTLYTLSEHPSILYSTRYPIVEDVSLSNFNHTFINTNPSVADMEGVLASKTGYTNLAGGNLVVILNANFNYPVVIVVMGSTFEGRFADVEILAEESRKYFY